nr:reverse transcriptase domain-containing protein [Tanacetum cinerariifolium]
MKISEFMHGFTNPELFKHLHDKISKSVDEMMRVTTTFLRGKVVASSRERKKSLSSWKQQEVGQEQNFKKGGFRNQQRQRQQKGENFRKGQAAGNTDGMNFNVVRSPSPYNGIIGRPRVRRIQEVPSIAHEMLKFPVTGETVTLWISRIIPLKCAMVSGPRAQQPVINQATEEKIQVAIHPEYPERTIAIGYTLTKEWRKELCGLLRRKLDIFAWKPVDMTRVPHHIA